ncbi:MAG TPA: hypothetical protein VIK50_05920 [Gemmatimonadaceae bacterium]
MKRLVLAVAVIAFAACAKTEEAPMADSPAAAVAPAIDSAAAVTPTDSTMKTDSAKKDTTKM